MEHMLCRYTYIISVRSHSQSVRCRLLTLTSQKTKLSSERFCTCPVLCSWKMAEPVFEPRCVKLKIQIPSVYHAAKVKLNAGSSQLLMLLCPIHYKYVGDIQKDNPGSWAFLFLKTTRGLDRVEDHVASTVPQPSASTSLPLLQSSSAFSSFTDWASG